MNGEILSVRKTGVTSKATDTLLASSTMRSRGCGYNRHRYYNPQGRHIAW
ncbi:hypothetical protein KCP73_01430 [Salmonella enterica subsp. enterica]|nr:hypothetical protein KCP73_01430 [Salmonella enterica subsp. enterica]